MKKLFLALSLSLLATLPACAQYQPNAGFPGSGGGGGGGSGTVSSGSAGQLAYYAVGGTTVVGNGNAVMSNGQLTLGQAGTAGAIVLNGATSGTVTLQTAAVAGTGTVFQFPATNGTNGQVLQTNGSGVTSWVTGGGGSGTVNSGTTPQLAYYASSTTAVSSAANTSIVGGTLTLGTAATTAGILVLQGPTSGSCTIQTAAAAGTSTKFQLPANNGTNGFVLQTDGTGITSWVTNSGGGGTVTSVAATGDGTVLNSTVTGSPVTGSGTLAFTLANAGAHTYLGNNTGSSAAPVYVTRTQLTADLNLFTTSLQGLVPASGGGTTNFLRADGTFAAPAGGGGGTDAVMNQFRCYTVTASPFTIGSSSGSANLYFGPCYGNQIYLNGALQTGSEVSLAASGLTTATAYDVYANSASSTTVALTTVAWSTPTTVPTRGTDSRGRLCKNGDATKLLVASIYAYDAGGGVKVWDYAGLAGVSNIYNKLASSLYAADSSTGWSYGSTIRIANGAASTSYGQAVIGVMSCVSSAIHLTNQQYGESGAGGAVGAAYICQDSTSTILVGALGGDTGIGALTLWNLSSSTAVMQAAGFHSYIRAESGSNSSNSYSANNATYGQLSSLSGITER